MAVAQKDTTLSAQVLTLIQKRGGRLTGPTRQVVAILADTHHHFTAEDIIAEVERRTPGVAPSTIYRLLQRLTELDLVEHVHSGDGPAFYHLRHLRHAHLLCSHCGTILDIPDTTFKSMARTIKNRYDFTIEPSHSAILGQCTNCANPTHHH